MLPPIRYPLPSLLALAALSLAAWKGEAWTRDARAALAVRMRRAFEGPPIPNSSRPRIVAGPVTRRALLLRDDTPASDRPGGRIVGTIARRMFVDVYDVWPEDGRPTHLRIGNRAPIGWVDAGDLLPWDTRLVVRAPGGRLPLAAAPGETVGATAEVGAVPCPVLGWTEDAVEVAVWDRDRPWSAVARRGWVPLAALPDDAWGVWIGDVELPIALRLAFGDDPSAARTLAALGRLADGQAWSRADLAAALRALPPWFPPASAEPRRARERLAEANAFLRSDASWGGLSFRVLPLDSLP